ncbi:5345_t:CDS:1, partial [Funneliformis geosporum]
MQNPHINIITSGLSLNDIVHVANLLNNNNSIQNVVNTGKTTSSFQADINYIW